MKSLLGVTLGALLLAAPAIAFAGSNGGGGGLAGVVRHPATAAFPDPSASPAPLAFASAGTTPGTHAGAVAQDITAISEALSGRNVTPFNSATLLANPNQRAGGR